MVLEYVVVPLLCRKWDSKHNFFHICINSLFILISLMSHLFEFVLSVGKYKYSLVLFFYFINISLLIFSLSSLTAPSTPMVWFLAGVTVLHVTSVSLLLVVSLYQIKAKSQESNFYVLVVFVDMMNFKLCSGYTKKKNMSSNCSLWIWSATFVYGQLPHLHHTDFHCKLSNKVKCL